MWFKLKDEHHGHAKQSTFHSRIVHAYAISKNHLWRFKSGLFRNRAGNKAWRTVVRKRNRSRVGSMWCRQNIYKHDLCRLIGRVPSIKSFRVGYWCFNSKFLSNVMQLNRNSLFSSLGYLISLYVLVDKWCICILNDLCELLLAICLSASKVHQLSAHLPVGALVCGR